MRAKEFIVKKRDPNWQTLQAKRTSGAAGAHKNKKKAAKQGDVKHKAKSMAEGYNLGGLEKGKYYLHSIYSDSEIFTDPRSGDPMSFDSYDEAEDFRSGMSGREHDEYQVSVFNQGQLLPVDESVSEGSDSTIATLDDVFNEHDFYRLEHIWPALEAGDKKEALRQINHYLRKGKNRAWWGDLQAVDIKIDSSDVENSMVMWSKPIKQGVEEGLLTEDPVTAFASKAHDEWRQGWIKQNGGKNLPRVKKNSDGSEGDINVPFNKLHPDWQRENLAAGKAAEAAVKSYPNALSDPDEMEKAAEFIHVEWMKRNPKADYNAAQHVSYDQLPEPEKEKDRVHVRTMAKLMGKTGGSVQEYGDTAKGQKMLTKVHKRAVDRMIKADDKRDAKDAKKNQQSANRAWDRFGEKEKYGEDIEMERVRDPEDWDEGNTEPPNNMAIYINGKKWKVFPGRGRYADDEREMKQFYDLKAWCQRKSEATGKKWEVSRTGEPATA